MNDDLIYFGGEVKSLGGNKVGGYLVRFGDAFKTDLEGDYFIPETDFDVDWTESVKSSVYFNHGLDKTLGKKKLGGGIKATLNKPDDIGIWIEAVLDERNEYEAAILSLVKDGKMGWSSGTAAHLIEKEKVGRAYKIVKWGLGLDATITPAPAESRNAAIPIKTWSQSIKALSDFIDNEDEESYLGNIALNLTCQSLCNASDRLESTIMWRILYNDSLTDEQKIQAITEAYQELAAFAPKVAIALLALDTEELNEQMSMAKSLAFDADVPVGVKQKIVLAKHADIVGKSVSNLVNRMTQISSFQVEEGMKKGAVFNSKNKDFFLKTADKIVSAGNEMMSHGAAMKDLVAPMETSDENKSINIEDIKFVEPDAAATAFAEYLLLESQLLQ